jgi:hypothetical protein
MKILILSYLSLMGPFLLAAENGLYFSPSASLMYGSGSSDSQSSLIGPGVALSGGLRFNSTAVEVELKRVNTSNLDIGDKTYETTIHDTIFSSGVRLFLNRILSIKMGIATHFVEMDIDKNGVKQTNDENDGEYFGLYGGMGIMQEFTSNIHGFLESNLYPIPEIDLYFIDMQIGFRVYL